MCNRNISCGIQFDFHILFYLFKKKVFYIADSDLTIVFMENPERENVWEILNYAKYIKFGEIP